MSLWTLQAKWNNKINSLFPFGDILQTPTWSLNRALPQQMLRCLPSADSAKAAMASGTWTLEDTRNPHLPHGEQPERISGHPGLHRKLEVL